MRKPLIVAHPDEADRVRAAVHQAAHQTGVKPPELRANAYVPKGQAFAIDEALLEEPPLIEDWQLDIEAVRGGDPARPRFTDIKP